MHHPFHCIPDFEFSSTLDAFDHLLEQDRPIAGVLIDVDGVLMAVEPGHPPPVVGENVDPAVLDKLAAVHERYGTCIVTNRIKRDDFDPESLESVFGVPVVRNVAPKPSREIFHAGLDVLGVPTVDANRTVMVGDSSYFDAYGASVAGLIVFQVAQDRMRYPLPQMVGKLAADGVQSTCKLLYRGYRFLPGPRDERRERPG